MSTSAQPWIGCGTATGNWPKPQDPDNNLILEATVFGGAVLLAVVAGSQHFK